MKPLASQLLANASIRFGAGVLGLLLLIAGLAPWMGTVDPAAMDSGHINTLSGTVGTFALLDGTSVAHTFWMGSDNFGRDIYSRVLYGTRVSLLVGLFTALAALLVGGTLGMLAGYFRAVDAVLMRFMDGLMAIPAILLAIALVAALGAQLWTVVVPLPCPKFHASPAWCGPWCCPCAKNPLSRRRAPWPRPRPLFCGGTSCPMPWRL
jgi:peptide/nickel transport system permease protein